MNSNDFAVAIAKRRLDLENEVFRIPPQSFDDFKERKGAWIELGKVLSMIEDITKKEMLDD